MRHPPSLSLLLIVTVVTVGVNAGCLHTRANQNPFTHYTPPPKPEHVHLDGELRDYALDVFREQVRDGAKRCAQIAIRQYEHVGGRVEIGFEVVRGVVSDAVVVENTTGHDGLGTCLVRVVEKVRFDRGTNGYVESVAWAIKGVQPRQMLL